MNLLKLSTLLLAALLTFTSVEARTAMPESWFREQGYVAPSASRIIACHGYGCRRRTEIAVQAQWFSQVGAIMRRASSSPEKERKGLEDVVRLYTAHVSRQIGGEPDAPKSPPALSGKSGQLDCLDETANTLSLLLILKDQGLLVHHDVGRPHSRGFFLDGRYPHTTAVIIEKRTGAEWVVDPWAAAPGQRPDLLPLERWQKVSS